MKRGCILALCVVGGLEPVSLGATVDFETVPLGSTYGEAFGHTPGDVVLTQDGIKMSAEDFLLGSFVGFIRAEVGGRYDDSFPTTPLELDNISVLFDFADVGFEVTEVTLSYQEFGGDDNFAVNGEMCHQLADLSDIPADVAPGVTATVQGGVISLAGDVNSFLIGGQELGIDDIVAVPEPTTLALLGLGAAGLLRRWQ